MSAPLPIVGPELLYSRISYFSAVIVRVQDLKDTLKGTRNTYPMLFGILSEQHFCISEAWPTNMLANVLLDGNRLACPIGVVFD